MSQKTFQESLSRFEKTSQAHEKDVVIDLAMDRIIKYFGAYGIGLLAAATIIFAVIGPVLTCDTTVDCDNPAKAQFVDSFCWGSTSKDNNACSLHIDNETELLDRHEEIKTFYQVFPYLLIGQAIAFMLPWAYWHFRMGSRLTGQILFMKSFLEEMHNLLKDVDKGKYTGKPFDKDSNTFYGGEKFEKEKTKKTKPTKAKLPDDEEASAELTKNKEITSSENVEVTTTKKNSVNKPKPSRKRSIWKSCKDAFFQLLTGKMKDRHLFSIFCYENFASMEYLPFLLSIFEASEQEKNIQKEPETDFYSMKACILYQWCHPKNFSNIRLTKVYFAKHLATALFALANVTGLVVWYLMFLIEGECIICTINRKREMFFFFWLDFTLLSLVLVMSVGHWFATRRSVDLAKCHYFEKIKRPCKVSIDEEDRRKQKEIQKLDKEANTAKK